MQAMRLAGSDVVLARSHYPNDSICSLSSLLHTAAATFGTLQDLKPSMERGNELDSKDGAAHPNVCASVPQPVMEKQSTGEPLHVNAEAGLRATTGSEVPPVADHENTSRDRSVHDVKEIMVAENVLSLQGIVIASECAPKGSAAPAQIEDSGHPQVSGTPLPVDVRAECQSTGKEDRGEIGATVFTWRKPEEAAALLRAVCGGWGAVES